MFSSLRIDCCLSEMVWQQHAFSLSERPTFVSVRAEWSETAPIIIASRWDSEVRLLEILVMHRHIPQCSAKVEHGHVKTDVH